MLSKFSKNHIDKSERGMSHPYILVIAVTSIYEGASNLPVIAISQLMLGVLWRMFGVIWLMFGVLGLCWEYFGSCWVVHWLMLGVLWLLT